MNNVAELKEFHWMMDMLQNIDVGLVVLNKANEIQLWNSFMENHSGVLSTATRNKNLFDLFPEIDKGWFAHKIESVFQLKIRTFSIWEQRPYIFKFKNYRPITGTAEFMYQNISIFPMTSAEAKVDHVCIIVYDVTDVASNRNALKDANLQLEKLSRTDRLTELNNRGYWQECLEKSYSHFKRYAKKFSLVIFDIDHFKKINDRYGHQAGDEVIKQCAASLLSCARETDICGRYGGEEFVVILTDSDEQQANVFSERLRKKIESQKINYAQTEIRYTVSLGVCHLTDGIDDANQWLSLADQALYCSKNKGRNCTSIAMP